VPSTKDVSVQGLEEPNEEVRIETPQILDILMSRAITSTNHMGNAIFRDNVHGSSLDVGQGHYPLCILSIFGAGSWNAFSRS
jgi:hypothetical protein